MQETVFRKYPAFREIGTVVTIIVLQLQLILIMSGYDKLVRFYENVMNMFNNVYENRSPISKSTISKVVRTFEETASWKNLHI